MNCWIYSAAMRDMIMVEMTLLTKEWGDDSRILIDDSLIEKVSTAVANVTLRLHNCNFLQFSFYDFLPWWWYDQPTKRWYLPHTHIGSWSKLPESFGDLVVPCVEPREAAGATFGCTAFCTTSHLTASNTRVPATTRQSIHTIFGQTSLGVLVSFESQVSNVCQFLH